MFRIVRNTRLLRKQIEELSYAVANYGGRRHLLSQAYRCEEEWNNRFSSPIIQKIKLDEMYHELEIKFHQEGKATAVDIDLFANAVRSEEHVEELEDLIHKLRLSENTSNMLPSTPHAVIRIFLELGKHEQLLTVLNDRINYGIFPDYYCSSLLMDTFIKAENYTAAAKVAAMEMLQEDWTNPLTTHLALYSCHMYLRKPGPEPWKEEVVEVDDTEEEIKVRVKYIRNPYFDDHFDLRDPQLLLGKTLATLGIALCDSVGYTYQLLGWALYKKWHRVSNCLQEIKEKKQTVYGEGVKMFEEELHKLSSAEDKSNSETEVQELCIQQIEQLKTLGLVSDDCFHTAVVNKVKAVVAEHELQTIAEQKSSYQDWEKLREKVLQEELKKMRTQRTLKQIEEEKDRLTKKEQELFFFDNFSKIELLLDEHKSDQKSEVKKQRETKVDDDTYIPPEIGRRRKK